MQNAMCWCFNNGIKQYLVPDRGQFWIIVNQQGNKTKSSRRYRKQNEAEEKMWEIYLYFYAKFNKI
jgi:hypothetical protein